MRSPREKRLQFGNPVGGARWIKEDLMQMQNEALAGMHHVADAAQMSDLEKKHVPVIHSAASTEPGNVDVTVVVGEHMRHPNEPAHFIQWIELWAADAFVARIDLTAAVAEPTVTITLALTGPVELTALEHCNIHGTWDGTATVG